jgi:hypothetical protein
MPTLLKHQFARANTSGILLGICNNTTEEFPLFYNISLSAQTPVAFWWAFAITPVKNAHFSTTPVSVP